MSLYGSMTRFWGRPGWAARLLVKPGHPDTGTQLVDDYVNCFRAKPIRITEASNNLRADWNTKGREYIQFWQPLQRRPTVQGVTYFVASAAAGTFDHGTWVGNNIGARLGAR